MSQPRLAIGLAVLNGALFTAFAFLTTQDKPLRAGMPWQDDPYDGVVSFTQFLVPALIILILMRLTLWRRDRPVPRFRADQLLRASLASVVLVGLTMLTDWAAVAVRADRPLWNASTPWLIAVVGLLSATSIGCAIAIRRARRRLPRGRSDGDWLDDLAQLVDQVFSGRRLDPRGPIAFLRGHIVAFAAGASLLGGLAMTGAQAIGEGWTDPVLIGTGIVVGTGGLFAFCLVSDAALHITVPRGHRGPGWVAAVVTCVGLPASAVLRGDIYGVLGLRGEVDTPAQLALVSVGGALVAGVLAFGLSLLAARAARRVA
ncbi:MAG TPA: hypothetical protein VJ914_17640 [Pseudonocardiaceae bacterium]|nr:hypothetical protein [Pseudonocardiaceae bacterium]